MDNYYYPGDQYYRQEIIHHLNTCRISIGAAARGLGCSRFVDVIVALDTVHNLHVLAIVTIYKNAFAATLRELSRRDLRETHGRTALKEAAHGCRTAFKVLREKFGEMKGRDVRNEEMRASIRIVYDFAKKYRDVANGIRKVAKGGPIVDATHVPGEIQVPQTAHPPAVSPPNTAPASTHPSLQELQRGGYKVSVVRTASKSESSRNASDRPIQIGLATSSRRGLFRRLGRRKELTVMIPGNSGISVNVSDKV